MKKKRLGLALGSGSARGFAHIGVLNVLEENGIKPDFVAGTSIGAAIGALYCSGMSPEYMKRLAISTEWQDLMDFTVPKTGMIAGNNVEEYIQTLTNNCKFSELAIPLRVVATDIGNAQKVIFSEGNVAKAVRASISIPGVFSPVRIGSRILVDGALIDPIPIGLVRDMGADVIVAVDLSKDFEQVSIPGSRVRERSTFYEYMKGKFLKTQIGFFKEFIMETKRFRLPRFIKKYLIKIIDKVFMPRKLLAMMTGRHMPDIMQIAVQSMQIMIMQIYKERIRTEKVDYVIRPKLLTGTISHFEDAYKYIKAGEESTRALLPSLKRRLGHKK